MPHEFLSTGRLALDTLLDNLFPDLKFSGHLLLPPTARVDRFGSFVIVCFALSAKEGSSAGTELLLEIDELAVPGTLSSSSSSLQSEKLARFALPSALAPRETGREPCPSPREQGREPCPSPRETGREPCPSPRETGREPCPSPRETGREPCPPPREQGREPCPEPGREPGSIAPAAEAACIFQAASGSCLYCWPPRGV